MRRFDPKLQNFVYTGFAFLRRKNFRGTRERHSIEACSIAIADVRFLFANLAATTFSRPAVAQDSSAAARPPVARFGPW